jgi:hypothetical protein
VEEAKASVSEREFRHWRVVFAREPAGVEALDWWMSQVVALLINVHRKRGASAVAAADLIPDRWGDRGGGKAVMKGKDLHDALKAWAGGNRG